MKNKTYLITILILLFAINSNSQTTVCENTCTYGSTQTYTKSYYNFKFTGPLAPYCSTTVVNINEESIFVSIDYRLATCNGQTTYIIDNIIFIDNRDYYENLYNCLPCNFFMTSTSAAYSLLGGLMGNPVAKTDMYACVKDAINSLVNSSGATFGVDILINGSCLSLVTLSFPDGSFIPQPPGDNGVNRDIHLTHNSVVEQLIPCNDVCCKVRYEYTITLLENGLTEGKLVPYSYEGGQTAECEAQNVPDYDTYINKTTAQILDPATGNYVTISGTRTGQGQCELLCSDFDNFCYSPMFISTGVKSNVPLILTANPTIINNFIHFTSNAEIEKIIVYDALGKKILTSNKLENNNLNTSEFIDGIYYVQVYITEKQVKTIKVIKL